jgi:hypothetical protein
MPSSLPIKQVHAFSVPSSSRLPPRCRWHNPPQHAVPPCCCGFGTMDISFAHVSGHSTEVYPSEDAGEVASGGDIIENKDMRESIEVRVAEPSQNSLFAPIVIGVVPISRNSVLVPAQPNIVNTESY